jgi:hypothetical protein
MRVPIVATFVKHARTDHSRLGAECAKLSPADDQAMAEEGIDDALAEWPKY